MRRLYTLLERAAESDATVLLGGETGTGKELAARAIHTEGGRRKGPFQVFDCAAVAPTLIASELFGYVRGAFSDAVKDRAGVFELADGGTVFLDEIGELPRALQPALLRVCDQGTVTRVGSTEARQIDVRMIAATRRDLAAEVVAGRFREDLFYRLQVVPIVMPPLRARREDLPLLLRRIAADLGACSLGPVEGPSLARLLAHPWPGNVRELRNVLERALVQAPRGARFVDLDFRLPPPVAPAGDGGDGSFQEQKREVVDRFERQFLTELMQEHDGNVKRASRASGIERTQLKRLLRKHDLL
jgi:DNA-binding NtrC family response regulator